MERGWPDLWRVFGRIGLMSFGGPAAQIALMHRELVENRRWLDEAEYLRALSFCMLLPGPEAMQLATYAGWKLRGIPGGLLAGGLFVLPGAAVILALAAGYAAFGALPWVAALFFGIKCSVVVIVVEALLRVARRALKGAVHRVIALASLVAILAFGIPFPAIILAAAILGAAWLQPSGQSTPAPAPVPARTAPRIGRVLAVGLVLWFLPLAGLWAAGADFLLTVGLFFSKLAVVTFGGAYAVLAYMTQTVVQDYGWIGTPQMMDALGLAETTPGPLILVTEFVAYLAGQAQGGWALGLVAAVLTLWVTFVPCFLWIFAFAPAVERIAGNPRLTGALAGVMAAVVGVIANLALWFALHVFFAVTTDWALGPFVLLVPDPASIVPSAVAVALAAGVALLRMHWPLPAVLAGSALMGLVLAGLS